ncbi:MAG: non-canonical purine NTP pyrophosphatase [Candidatus Nealsonbacteria bacterium]|nr:non-canonical purine NTP pyrophosphatase [Candidatus Nealsonbacteria bacterium]
MKKLLVATTNPGKILEYRVLLKNLPLELVTLKDVNIKDGVEEDGKTFEENAIKKVKFYSQFVDFPTLAEDAGLEIDYLDGEPGVKTRRWLGREASDQELIDLTLAKLKGVPAEQRGARLKTVIALNIFGKINTFEGILRGVIMEKPIDKIIPGYPFRSLFFVPGVSKVLGEFTMEEEAKIAHRKKAVEKALPLLSQYLREPFSQN